jgi:hypothetical protein
MKIIILIIFITHSIHEKFLKEERVSAKILLFPNKQLFAIVQSYEGNNDAATVARQPAFKIMAGKTSDSAGYLAS